MDHKKYKKFYFAHRWFRRITDKLPDAIYLSMLYYFQTGQVLHLKNPKSYNEKLQFLKLYYRNDEMTIVADKFAVRQWVAKKIGSEYLVPLIGRWTSTDEIEFSRLPQSFVLKCTHDSGSIIVCHDKKKFDWENAINQIKKRLEINYYYYLREWPYKNIPPQIIAEPLLSDSGKSDHSILDYKFFCFMGEPKLLMIVKNRFTEPKSIFLNESLHPLALEMGNQSFDYSEITIPTQIMKMFELAKILSKGYPHVRIDLFCNQEKIYFNEITFFHWGGLSKINPPEMANTIGSWIKTDNLLQ